MKDKEKLISYLAAAKADYEKSIAIAKNGFFKRWRYKRLSTSNGLAQYFWDKFNAGSIVDVHLRPFKPEDSLSVWFPLDTVDGFESRLKVINDAIVYYTDKEEVPLLLEGSLLEYLHLYTAYERKEIPENPISMFISKYYDELMDSEQG